MEESLCHAETFVITLLFIAVSLSPVSLADYNHLCCCLTTTSLFESQSPVLFPHNYLFSSPSSSRLFWHQNRMLFNHNQLFCCVIVPRDCDATRQVTMDHRQVTDNRDVRILPAIVMQQHLILNAHVFLYHNHHICFITSNSSLSVTIASFALSVTCFSIIITYSVSLHHNYL